MDQSAFERKTGNILLDVIASNHIKDEVNSLTSRNLFDLFYKIIFAVIDRMVCAKIKACLAFFIRAGSCNYSGTKNMCQLNRGGPYSTRPTMDQNGFPFFKAATLKNIGPYGKIIFGYTGRFNYRKSIWTSPAPNVGTEPWSRISTSGSPGSRMVIWFIIVGIDIKFPIQLTLLLKLKLDRTL